MKYSYNWLKELSGTKKSPKELAKLLTMRAFEVEGMKTGGKETQLEISILPNRGHDALSHIGMAREICAVEGRKSSFLRPSLRKSLRLGLRMKVEIKDKKLCPRYIGAIIENIEVGSLPKWMRERLLVSGIKPINNIVDITNYVMLETGQSLHAFDAEKITGNIIVRKARKGEKIKLLDEKLHELNENNLVIADSEKALALAGVMGGFGSSINKKTTSIILESANFNPTNIRKTRMSQNIITESSYRFEREIDPNLAEMGIARAIELLKKYGGKDVKVVAVMDIYPKKVKPWQIGLNTSYVNSLLGEKIPVAKMKNILENLGIIVKNSKNILNCEIPTRRIDLKTQEDLIEEIGRIYGYENIKEQAPRVELSEVRENKKINFENQIRDILVGLGFSEVLNYSFYGLDDIEKCNLKLEDHIEVANPMNPDQQYMRTSLIPGLAKNVKLNLKYFDKFSIFEIGRAYFKKGEKTIIAGVFIDTKNKNPFFDLKGRVEALLGKLGIMNYELGIRNQENSFWNPVRTADIKINNFMIGKVGELKPLFEVSPRIAMFEIDVEKLLEISAREKLYRVISKYPIVERDISMFIGKDTRYADIATNIQKSGGNLVKEIILFDVFEKENQNSLAIRLEIGSDSKTLTSVEIDAVMKKIISALEKKLRVRVRK